MYLNNIQLIGRLTSDPKTKQFDNGGQLTHFTVATNYKYKDRNEKQQEEVEFHPAVCNNKLSEIASQYLKKGSAVYINGRISTRKWEQDGEEKSFKEIKVQTLQMLDKKESTSKPSNIDDAYSNINAEL